MMIIIGTHYCDITGEVDFAKEMIVKYENGVKVTGSRIVHFCGLDSVPWDLSTLKLSESLQKNGEHLDEIHFFYELKSKPSGGTLATLRIIFGKPKYSCTGPDPWMRTKSGETSRNMLINANQRFAGYSKEGSTWLHPFIMADCNADVVSRSNALNNYSRALKYAEGQVSSSFMSAFVQSFGIYVAVLILLTPLTDLLMKIGVLPKQGEGPSEEFMQQGFLKVTVQLTNNQQIYM